MRVSNLLKAPVWAMGVLGKDKSFVVNPIIGNLRLNTWGLHLRRVRWAAAMTARRRRQLARHLETEQAATFDRDGYLLVHDFLPADHFARLREAVETSQFKAREMRQGCAVTRMTPLTTSVLAQHPAVAAFYELPQLRALFQYAASWSGTWINFVETVLADPPAGDPDPQTDLHSDTFHSSGKFWLFLHDVSEDGGPFRFVPGSHRITSQRLEWEFQNSLDACSSERAHHTYGSFRVSEEELPALGYGPSRRFPVPANSLLIADTFGFHARSPSERPTTRLSLHGHLRRNPFIPWTGLDAQSLPGIRNHQLDLFLAYMDWRERRGGKRTIWRDVGVCNPLDPAHI